MAATTANVAILESNLFILDGSERKDLLEWSLGN